VISFTSGLEAGVASIRFDKSGHRVYGLVICMWDALCFGHCPPVTQPVECRHFLDMETVQLTHLACFLVVHTFRSLEGSQGCAP
jgi:hypothetical protein